MIRFLLWSAAVLATCSALPAHAQTMPPRADFDTATSPSITIDQIGTASPGIAKDARAAEIAQIPESNRAILNQSGADNMASLTQTGSSLSATVIQQGDMNLSAILQSGTGHAASVTQTSDGNRSFITQSGSGNTATITQGR